MLNRSSRFGLGQITYAYIAERSVVGSVVE